MEESEYQRNARLLGERTKELETVKYERDNAQGFRRAADEALQRCHGHAAANHNEIEYLRRALKTAYNKQSDMTMFFCLVILLGIFLHFAL